MNYKLIKCENLKNQSNIIFKGLIKNAYYEVFEGNKAGKKNTIDYFENKLITDKDGDMDLSSELIVLEFKNGATVLFSNSEWGRIGIVKDIGNHNNED